MDLFQIVDGEITDTRIEGVEKITWIERYKGPTECIIVGDPLLLLNTLPLEMEFASLSSQDILIAESLVIDESKPSSAKAELRCRSRLWYDMDRTLLYPGPVNDAILEGLHHEAIATLIMNALNYPVIFFCGYSLQYYANGGYRLLTEKETLSNVIYDLLLPDDTGLKTVRPNPNRLWMETLFIDPLSEWYYDFGEGSDPKLETYYVLYNGRLTTAEFDLNSGDNHKVRYSWTKRPIEDIRYCVPAAKSIIIEIVSTKDDPIYRINYDVGDVVYIYGNYGINGNFRVIEVANIEDKTEEKTIVTFAPVYYEYYQSS